MARFTLRELTRKRIDKMSNKKLARISQRRIKNIPAHKFTYIFLKLRGRSKTYITEGQVQGIPAAELTQALISHLLTTQRNWLTQTQVAGIPAEELTATLLGLLPEIRRGWITPAQITEIPGSNLTSRLLERLSRTERRLLTPGQITEIPGERFSLRLLRQLSPTQRGWITRTQVERIGGAELLLWTVGYLSETQRSWITEAQVKKILTWNLEHRLLRRLSAEQRGWITQRQVAGIRGERLKPELLSLLSAEQRGWITQAQVIAVPADQLTPELLSFLSPTQRGWITQAQAAAIPPGQLTPELLNLLSAEQRGWTPQEYASPPQLAQQLSQVQQTIMGRIGNASSLVTAAETFLKGRNNIGSEARNNVLRYCDELDVRYRIAEAALQNENWRAFPKMHDSSVDEKVNFLRSVPPPSGPAAEEAKQFITHNLKQLIEAYKAFCATITLVSGNTAGQFADIHDTLEEVILTAFAENPTRDTRVVFLFPFAIEALGQCIEGNGRYALRTYKDKLNEFDRPLPPPGSNVDLFNYYVPAFVADALGAIEKIAPSLFEGHVPQVTDNFYFEQERENRIVNRLNNVRYVQERLHTLFKDGIFAADVSEETAKIKAIATAIQQLARGARDAAGRTLQQPDSSALSDLPTLSTFFNQRENPNWQTAVAETSSTIRNHQDTAEKEFNEACDAWNADTSNDANIEAAWIAAEKKLRTLKPDETKPGPHALPGLKKLVPEETDLMIKALSLYPAALNTADGKRRNLLLGTSCFPKPPQESIDITVNVKAVDRSAKDASYVLEVSQPADNKTVTLISATDSELQQLCGRETALSQGQELTLRLPSKWELEAKAKYGGNDPLYWHAADFRKNILEKLKESKSEWLTGEIPGVVYKETDDIATTNAAWISKTLEPHFQSRFLADRSSSEVTNFPDPVRRIVKIMNDLVDNPREGTRAAIASEAPSASEGTQSAMQTFETYLSKNDHWQKHLYEMTATAAKAASSPTQTSDNDKSAEDNVEALTSQYLRAAIFLEKAGQKDYHLVLGVEGFLLPENKEVNLWLQGQDGDRCMFKKTNKTHSEKTIFASISETALRSLTNKLPQPLPAGQKLCLKKTANGIQVTPLGIDPIESDRTLKKKKSNTGSIRG